MSPQDIERLRSDLTCSVGELATALGVETKTVLAWEAGELFPTKRHVERMNALQKAGPESFPRKRRGKKAPSGLELLGDARFWCIVRKLLFYPELLTQVEKLADRYDDPAT
jgi:hypothetical protein